jgi:hypothetical protein
MILENDLYEVKLTHMKTLLKISFVFLISLKAYNAPAQKASAHSDEFTVDLTDTKNLKDSSVPLINWLAPVNETIFLREAKLFVKLEVTSPTPLKTLTLSVKEQSGAALRGSQIITPKENEKYKLTLEKSIAIPEGVNVLELVVENTDGVRRNSAG